MSETCAVTAVATGVPGASIFATYQDGTPAVIGFGTPAPIPEPTSLLLIGSGLVGLAMRRRRERHR